MCPALCNKFWKNKTGVKRRVSSLVGLIHSKVLKIVLYVNDDYFAMSYQFKSWAGKPVRTVDRHMFF